MRHGWFKWVIVLAVCSCGMVGSAHGEAVRLPNPFRHRIEVPKIPRRDASVPTIARGAALFARACLSCHGPRGDGEGFAQFPGITAPPLNQLSASEWSATRIAHAIQNGDGAMPEWGLVLSPTEIQSLTLYIESLNGHVAPIPKSPSA